MSQPKTSQADYGPCMLRTLLVALALALGLATAASASAPRHFYVPRPHKSCRAHYVRRVVRIRPVRHGGRIVRRHGRIVWVRQARCFYVVPAPKPTPTPTPSPSTPLGVTAPQVVRAGIDPSYTQDSTDPLRVTWTYSANANGTLPAGTLSFSVSEPGVVGPSGGCVINVGGAATGGTCTVELPQYGQWQTIVSYTGNDPNVAPSTQTSTDTIEPPPTTVNYMWGADQGTASPNISATVIGPTASITVTDPNFEGATGIGVTDNLGDGCSATISGTQATCQMPVTGTPSAFSLTYPGGTSTAGTQNVPPNGVQQVTYRWPATTVPVSHPSVTVQQAQVLQCGGGQQGGPLWNQPGTVVGCGPNPGNGMVSGQWPNPVTIGTGLWVGFGASAVGNVAGDTTPQGYLTYTITGPAAPASEIDLDYGANGPNGQPNPNTSQDCSQVTNTGNQAIGGCQYTFSTPGAYTLTVRFHSWDANYADAQMVGSETIDVS